MAALRPRGRRAGSPPVRDGVPARLAERPVDPAWGLPVPFANEYDDGGVDFRTVNPRRAIQCALSRLCGMCGRGLEFDIAFVGGAMSAEVGAFAMPPMHVDCALAALALCPHVARHATPEDAPGRERRPLRRGVPTPDLFAADRPSEWVLHETHNFEIERTNAEDGALVLLFHPGPAQRLRSFRATEHGIDEILEGDQS